MIDNENYVHASLTKKDYIKIESMITNLYVELKIKILFLKWKKIKLNSPKKIWFLLQKIKQDNLSF